MCPEARQIWYVLYIILYMTHYGRVSVAAYEAITVIMWLQGTAISAAKNIASANLWLFPKLFGNNHSWSSLDIYKSFIIIKILSFCSIQYNSFDSRLSRYLIFSDISSFLSMGKQGITYVKSSTIGHDFVHSEKMNFNMQTSQSAIN